MPEDKFGKAKEDFKVFVAGANTLTRLARLKLDVKKKKSSRENAVKTVGTKVYALWEKDKALTETALRAEVLDDLTSIQAIENEISELEKEMGTLKDDFRAKVQPTKKATEPQNQDQK